MALELSGNAKVVRSESAGNQNQWADKTKSDVLFGYDADTEVEKWWAAHRRGLELLVPIKSKL